MATAAAPVPTPSPSGEGIDNAAARFLGSLDQQKDRGPARIDAAAGTALYRRYRFSPCNPTSASALVRCTAATTPNRRALTFEVRPVVCEMQYRIDCLANHLRLGGVCHGDRVGFIGLNQPAFFETMSQRRASAPSSCRSTSPDRA